MKMKLLLKIIIFTILNINIIYAYEFSSSYISLSMGYKNDSLHMMSENSFVNSNNSIDEDFKDINLFNIGLQAQYIKEVVLFYLEAQYSIGNTNKAETAIKNKVENYSGSASYDFIGKIEKKAKSDQENILFGVGYPFSWGPFELTPGAGFSYNRQYYSRSTSNAINESVLINNIRYQSTYGPDNKMLDEWYLPFVNIQFILTPIAAGRLQFLCEYRFHYGRLKHQSKYYYDSTVTETTNTSASNYLEKLLAKVSAYSHLLKLKGYYGISNNCICGINFDYQYWKGKQGNSNIHLTGIKSSTSPSQSSGIDQNLKKHFTKLRKQTFTFSFNIGYQF